MARTNHVAKIAREQFLEVEKQIDEREQEVRALKTEKRVLAKALLVLEPSVSKDAVQSNAQSCTTQDIYDVLSEVMPPGSSLSIEKAKVVVVERLKACGKTVGVGLRFSQAMSKSNTDPFFVCRDENGIPQSIKVRAAPPTTESQNDLPRLDKS